MALSGTLSRKDLKLLDLVMSGEAARICGVDRRTFWKKVELWAVKPEATVEGKSLYKRSDIEKMAERIRKERKEKGR